MDNLELKQLKLSAINYAESNGFDNLTENDLSIYYSRKKIFQGFLINVIKGKEVWQYCIKPSLGGFSHWLQSKIETDSLERVYQEKVMRDIEKQFPTLKSEIEKEKEKKLAEQIARKERYARIQLLTEQFLNESLDSIKNVVSITPDISKELEVKAIEKANKQVEQEEKEKVEQV